MNLGLVRLAVAEVAAWGVAMTATLKLVAFGLEVLALAATWVPEFFWAVRVTLICALLAREDMGAKRPLIKPATAVARRILIPFFIWSSISERRRGVKWAGPINRVGESLTIHRLARQERG